MLGCKTKDGKIIRRTFPQEVVTMGGD